MKIHSEIKQGTPEWHALRCGVITASRVSKLLTAKGALADNDTSRGLVNELARERMTVRAESQHESWDMARGKEMEPIARDYYHRLIAPVEEVGFVTSEIGGIVIGCSPDGLVGEEGMIEIKSRNEAIHFKEVLSGEVPSGDLPQIQFQLLITGRAWCDYVSFCDGWPLFVKRVLPCPTMRAAIIQAVTLADKAVAAVIQTYELASLGLHPTDKIPEASNAKLI